VTAYTTYTCNLCRENIVEGTGVGVLWSTTRNMTFTTPGQSQVHLCQSCLDNIEMAISDLRENERKRDEIAAATG
jgi:hypothetical protein